MSRFALPAILWLCLGGWAAAQQDSQAPDKSPGKDQSSASSAQNQGKEGGQSSSRDTKIDLSPPADDVKSHPYTRSSASSADADTTGDVQEFHPWDPHKAAKDIEVGDFYFKRKNYRAALDRYREALYYKSNDALANFHMGQCLEKLDSPEEAAVHYQEYLKILPHGPLSLEAQKALDNLKDKTAAADGKK